MKVSTFVPDSLPPNYRERKGIVDLTFAYICYLEFPRCTKAARQFVMPMKQDSFGLKESKTDD